MPAQIPDSIADWSTTAGSNQPSGSANVGPDLDDNLRAMQVAVRQTYTRGTIASAATCDIGTVDAELISVTGTTGISSLGTTLGATGYGVHKLLTFAGALTLTHSASLACITSANITTAAGDSCMVEYSASGWTMLWYARKTGAPVAVQSFALSDLSNATALKTLANGVFTQTWGWAGLTGSTIGFRLTGNSTVNAGVTMSVEGNGAGANQPAEIFRVIGTHGTSPILSVTPNAFVLRPPTRSVAGNGANCSIGAESAEPSTSGVSGGTLSLFGGSSGLTGAGGNIVLQAGSGTTTPGACILRDATSVLANVTVNATAVTMGGTTKTVLDTKHVYIDNTNGAPTVTSGGGTGVTIAGSDVAFEVIAGTGSPTTFTVTFANAWATAPQVVMASCSQAGVSLSYAATTTTVQISTDSAWSSGAKISVLCLGLQ